MTIGEKHIILGEEFEEISREEYEKQNLINGHITASWYFGYNVFRYFRKKEKNPFEDIKNLLLSFKWDLFPRNTCDKLGLAVRICNEQLKKEKEP